MLAAMDDGVGRVMATLQKRQLEENTLVFFFSDNGGPTMAGTTINGASNAPLRGSKRQTYEGGIRVPFIVHWKGRLGASRVDRRPIIQLDVLPTALAAAGIAVDPAWRLDGVNLLIAHVALTSLPSRAYRDINELEVEESAFDRAFDLVVLGHYHAVQKISKRTWYAGSTDTFSFADSPETTKGLVVVDTGSGALEHVENPHERPLATV